MIEALLGLLVILAIVALNRKAPEIQKVEVYEDDINPHVEVINGAYWWKNGDTHYKYILEGQKVDPDYA